MNSSAEQKYYENPALWIPEVNNDKQRERAQLTVKALPSDIKSVLDLGCGNGVVTDQIQEDLFVVGVDRSVAALKWVRSPHCRADAISLPFSNNAFDVVVSTEMIEHLPTPAYAQALREMIRIARRYILLTVPYCEDLGLGLIVCPICNCRFHRNYHMRSFQRLDLKELFGSRSDIHLVRAEGIVEMRKRLFPKIWKLVWSIRRKMLDPILLFPQTAICPQCQYSKTASLPSVSDRRQLKKVSPLLQWPQKSSFNWWIALYRKDQ